MFTNLFQFKFIRIIIIANFVGVNGSGNLLEIVFKFVD